LNKRAVKFVVSLLLDTRTPTGADRRAFTKDALDNRDLWWHFTVIKGMLDARTPIGAGRRPCIIQKAHTNGPQNSTLVQALKSSFIAATARSLQHA